MAWHHPSLVLCMLFEAWRAGNQPPEYRAYVDMSLRDGNWQYAGLCARRGWASAVMDGEGRIAAAAKGQQ